MGKICRVVVCGGAGVGKTALLEQTIYGTHTVGKPMVPTIEDIYVAHVETNRGVKEQVRFYDTKGLDATTIELAKHYYSLADGFILVYSITSQESFRHCEAIKKEIDKLSKEKDKKEVCTVIIGNKADLYREREVEFDVVSSWAHKEKILLYEVTVANRKGLMEPIVSLTSKLTQPTAKSTFALGKFKSVKQQSSSSNDHKD
ncbi:NF-kappa-B inhibitor-interacting Ras-like protein 2 isoform X2 [Amphiura filiformis]|uniref:NF-kappa-B inhibitor-interacting Ras-like protein 2 isoform X2 n=1 Tax=Amphiura filiformis TaxID=82378 RepID=UPI003B2281B9